MSIIKRIKNRLIKGRLKRVLAIGLVVASITQTSLSTVSYAYENNYSLLGTNVALGSAILDNNFVADDWNKWEMLTWGIFLSNFPVPLLDDYDSAFNSNTTYGSKGSGYKALSFGSGSDPANEETIKSMLNYAVTQQKSGTLQPIYVDFSSVKRDKINKKEVTETSTLREASFKDLFLMTKKDDGDSWVNLGNTDGWYNGSNKIVPIEGTSTSEALAAEFGKSERYISITTINDGALPTFYVKSGSGYENVFDYTDGWDAQLMTAWLSRIASSADGEEFKKVFNDMWSQNSSLKLYLDTFGNIVVTYGGSRRIVIPASINQHLTSSPKINLVSSMLFNGYSSSVSGTELALRGQQSISGWWGGDLSSKVRFGGLPAFGSNISGIDRGLITMYYDLDTIAYQNYFKGGAASNGTKTVSGEDNTAYKLHYGKAIKQLFDLDINKSTGNNYIFKIEATNMDKFNFDGLGDGKAGEALKTLIKSSGEIANIAGGSVNAKILSKLKTPTGDLDMFSSPVIIPVQTDSGKDGNTINASGVSRLFVNYLYKAYTTKLSTAAGNLEVGFVDTLLKLDTSATMKSFKESILGINTGTVSTILAHFLAENKDLFKLNVDGDKLYGATLSKDNIFKKIDSIKVDGTKAITPLYKTEGTLDYFPGRLIKAYPTSEVMLAVGDTLGVRDGTQFSVYSTYIYMTYLDWYGVSLNKMTGQVSADFNSKIFNGTEEVLQVDITAITDIKSEDDKKAEVLNYTYMMLHPTEGKEYRNKMMNDYVSNFIYDTYQKIVYGNSTSYSSSASSNLATRNATGFLNIDTYADNFTTSWFISMYGKIATILIGIAFIAIILIGLLKSRSVSWYLVALAVVINTILIVPVAGEITPLIINNYVQKMFSSKMTYWGISESVTNSTMESDYINKTNISTSYLGSLTPTEQTQVVDLVKGLNTVYLDRALMIKSDISRKVTLTSSGNYSEIQSLRSARWLLPMIMRQFTANDGSADYVYVPLGDMYDDLSNMYWLYKPEDSFSSETILGSQGTVDDGSGKTVAKKLEPIKLTDRPSYFPDYKNTSTLSGDSTIPYRSQAYYNGNSLDDMPHTYFYLLKTNANPLNRNYGFGGEYEGEKSYKKYVETSIQSGKAQSFLSTATLLEQQAGTYNRTDRSTLQQSYGYLWATESPYHYSYQSIKDTFSSGISLGSLVGKLQGQYVETESGTEVRTSFMHAGETGYIRDILDLQEMFTNMIPYLYQMQLTAGGLDGASGVLGSAEITDYKLYENNYKSWLFRSNWVTKIMESPDYTKPATIRDNKGNKIKIANPTLVDSYPSNRPMVFSEAQMYEQGLSEADLNIVELKAIAVNKAVAIRWTLLLNYSNVKGMTKEVMLRQMATESVLAFNAEYSPNGLFDSAYQLYPNGLDLRAISFDSVMKMLMLNVTKDTSYIYGDTMQNIVSNSDIISAGLLLVSAFLSSYIIPLVRNIVLGAIFYLGFVAIVYSLLSDNKSKAKVSFGYIISNILFTLMTLLYYVAFSSLMAITTSDSVLTVQSVQVNTGNPVWCFIIIIALSIVYIISMFKMINFCFKNFRDMGFEVYSTVANSVAENLGGKLSNIGDKIANFGNESGSSTIPRGNSGGNTGTDTSNNVNNPSFKFDYDNNDYTHTKWHGGSDDDTDTKYNDYSYGDDYIDESDSTEIDKEIEKGKKED